MTFPADTPPPKAPRGSIRFWNACAAAGLLFCSGWTLLADLSHDAHFLLQPSLSSLFLGLLVMGWTVASIVSAGFPKRYLTPAILLVTLRLSFAWPITIWFDLRHASLLLDGFLVLLGLVYFFASFTSKALTERPGFRWQHSLAAAIIALIASVLSLPTGVLGLARVIEDTSAGYVRLTPQGIRLTERIFEKDGRRVHLIGMAHIADGGFYQSLNGRLAEAVEGRRLVLLEGVTDREKILPQSFASGETYRVMAEKLGLAEQSLGFAMQSEKSDTGGSRLEAWAELGVDFRQADIDVSELDPAHREHLVALLDAAADLDLERFFSMPGDMTAKELEDLVVEGLVKRRNAHLMEVFAEHERHYSEVFIPWGAAHLPDLERRLAAQGYVSIGETQRLGIDFWNRFR